MKNIFETINDRLNISSPSTVDTNTVSTCLNLYKKKVIANGLSGNNITDTKNQMEKSFISALANSPSSEEVIILDNDDGLETRLALINQESKAEWDTVKEIISMPFSSGIGIGKVVDWIRTENKYLVLSQNYAQKGYFSGEIVQCNFVLKWKIGAEEYSQWIISDKFSVKSAGFQKSVDSLMVDTGKEMTIFIGIIEGREYPKKYERIIINDKSWRIVGVNNMENSKIIKMDLVENYIDESKDDRENGVADNTDYGKDSFSSLLESDL